jgi:hypothetical protein
MNDLATQDAMLAVFGFQVSIKPERPRSHLLRQGPAQVLPIASEPGVQHGNFDPLPTISGRMPAVGTKPGQVFELTWQSL